MESNMKSNKLHYKGENGTVRSGMCNKNIVGRLHNETKYRKMKQSKKRMKEGIKRKEGRQKKRLKDEIDEAEDKCRFRKEQNKKEWNMMREVFVQKQA